MDSSVQQRLLERLRKIDRPGTFCTSGLLTPMLPGLEVAGMGPVALPFEKRQAAVLKKTLRLPLAQHRRQHLHQVIDNKKLDTTHTTERRGRPYTLVCTKSKASYERALKAHHVDLDHLAKVRGLLEWHEGLEPNPDRVGRDAAKKTKKK